MPFDAPIPNDVEFSLEEWLVPVRDTIENEMCLIYSYAGDMSYAVPYITEDGVIHLNGIDLVPSSPEEYDHVWIDALGRTHNFFLIDDTVFAVRGGVESALTSEDYATIAFWIHPEGLDGSVGDALSTMEALVERYNTAQAEAEKWRDQYEKYQKETGDSSVIAS